MVAPFHEVLNCTFLMSTSLAVQITPLRHMTQSYGLGAKCPALVTPDAQVTPVYGI